jgi:predicted TIM-barrel fold metal-dependent hydrolase
VTAAGNTIDEDVPAVDAHAHVFARDMPLAPDAWTRPEYDFTVEDYLAELDAHGIAFGVLSGLSISGFNNEYTLAAVRGRERLRATVIVPPDIDRATLAAMRDDGAVGIRFQLARAPVLPDLAGDAYRNLARHVRDLGWHVHIAVEGLRLPPLLAALEGWEVPIVIDHFGHPDPDDPLGCDGLAAALAAVQRGSTWIKLAAGFRLAGTDSWREPSLDRSLAIAAQVAAYLLREASPERLLWGSDCPFVGYEGRVRFGDALAQLRQWVPDPRDRRAMSDAAFRFYFA